MARFFRVFGLRTSVFGEASLVRLRPAIGHMWFNALGDRGDSPVLRYARLLVYLEHGGLTLGAPERALLDWLRMAFPANYFSAPLNAYASAGYPASF
jgi:hypothetical protein